MFESLAQKLGDVFRQLRSRGLLTDENMAEGMRQIRTALLEADVNYRVARDFVQAVSEKAVGQQVIKSVSPGSKSSRLSMTSLSISWVPPHQSSPWPMSPPRS